MPEAVTTIARSASASGGRALLVGGYLRDTLLGCPSKDIDVEVFGLPVDLLESVLKAHFRIDAVGRSFGVFKVKGLELDVALPRRESKAGTGHKGFLVEGDPSMSIAEAASRRDFTINAIYFDPLTGEWLDPFDGRADIECKRLRHTSAQFAEDPLRVLRAMQFAARFDLTVAPETLELCRSIEPEDLPPERIFEEWRKLILKGQTPSTGLTFLRDCGWVRYFPELEALVDCPQDPVWHPEGDVWAHTLHCLDAFARTRTGESWEDLIVGLAVLCHDLGKPATTYTDENGRIRSPRHEIVGLKPAGSFLSRMTRQRAIMDEVLPLVECHMRPAMLANTGVSDAAVRRLANKVKRIDRLIRVCRADMGGRPPKPGDFPAGERILERAQELAIADAAPQPLLLGRHLLKLGLRPGPHFSEILSTAYDAQLAGEFSDEAAAIAWVKRKTSGPADG